MKAMKILNLAQAKDEMTSRRSSFLVAIRMLNYGLLEEAAREAAAAGDSAVYIDYAERGRVKEYQSATVSSQSLSLLESAARVVEALGVRAIPLWQIGENPGKLIAEAVKTLGVKTVMIGTAKRRSLTALFQLRFLRALRQNLPPTCNLVILG
jgi:hypothetical protein